MIATLALAVAVIVALAIVLFFVFRSAVPIAPVPPVAPTRRQRVKEILNRALPIMWQAAQTPKAKRGLAWVSAEVDPAPICVGPHTGNVVTVSTPTAGICPPEGLLCPGLRCSGAVPMCVDPAGSPSCPVCAAGAPRCALGDYYHTDPSTWQAGPSGDQISPYQGASANFPYCSQLGSDCSWASINSGSRMKYTGRGAIDPDKTTGYRIISSSGETFYRDAGWDNTSSFFSSGLEAASAESLEDCEQQALEPTTNNGVPVAGSYAYVYDALTGNCDLHRLQGTMSVHGTVDYVKAQQ